MSVGHGVIGQFQKWMYERDLHRTVRTPVPSEKFFEAAKSLGLYHSTREGQESMLVLFRAGVEYPPKNRLKRFLMRRYRWAAKMFGPCAGDFRYIFVDNFSYNRGVAPASAPAYIVREMIAYEYDAEEEIIGVRVREDLLYNAPSQEDFRRWGSGDLEDPGKMIGWVLELPKEEVIPLPESVVYIRRTYGFALVFESEAASFVKEDLARKEEELQEFKKENDKFLRS